jgi:hypothetical protein
MTIRERPRLGAAWLALLMVVVVTVALAATTPREAPQEERFVCERPTTTIETPTAKPTADELRARAERLYRQKQFHQAVKVLAPSDDPDLVTLAEQYRQLAHAWDRGMGLGSPVRDAFRALRTAWKLDTVLGGAFGHEIQQRLAHIAPLAALAFLDDHDAGAAESALHVAETLGVHNEDTRQVSSALANHSATHN